MHVELHLQTVRRRGKADEGLIVDEPLFPARIHESPCVGDRAFCHDVHVQPDQQTELSAMKKISTGERIKFADLRRRSVGGPRGDADSDVTTEQLFVSELMDTTPSSSYEGETWREGYVYNPRDASVSDLPLAPYDSDGEAADEVVTGTQEVVGKADLIVKEDVPEVHDLHRREGCVDIWIYRCR